MDKNLGYENISNLEVWCQKVLPLVYDESLSYYEVLCKVVEKLNETITATNNIPSYIKNMFTTSGALDTLQEQIAKQNDHDSKTATKDRKSNTLIWLNGELYKIVRDMLAGDQYVEDSDGATGNIKKITIEEWVNVFVSVLNEYISTEIQTREELISKKNEETVVHGSTNSTVTTDAKHVLIQGAESILSDAKNISIDANNSLVVTSPTGYKINGTNYSVTNTSGTITNEYNKYTENVIGTRTIHAGSEETYLSNNERKFHFADGTSVDIHEIPNLINSEAKTRAEKDAEIISDTTNKITELKNSLKDPTFINVKDYGAKGDGTTDDTDIIQSVLNNNLGKTIYFPKGVYIITKSLILPDNATLLGETHESQLKANANNISILTNDKFIANKYNADVSGTRCNITIANLSINGNFVASPFTNYNNDQPAINTGNIGIALYGNPLRFYDVWVYNCEQYGITTVNGGGNNQNAVPINEESVFLNCVVKFNGKDGWRYLGPHDGMMCNCIVASNSRLSHNAYDNLKIEKYNLRIVNSHFYSDYGVCKPRYSILLTGAQCNISNCHIEGGGTANLAINSPYNQISNCHIYASFGTTDVEINSAFNIITNCLLEGRVSGEPGVSSSAWRGAFAFTSTFYNFIHCELSDTSFTALDSAPAFSDSHIEITGKFENNYAIKGFVPLNNGNNYISIMGNFLDTNTLVLPAKTYLPKLTPYGRIEGINLTDNHELQSYVSVVWSQDESKHITLPKAEYGAYLIIVNRTASWLHLVCRSSDTLNSASEGYGSASTNIILVCGADGQWLSANTLSSKPS